jgi:hypothetical protein
LLREFNGDFPLILNPSLSFFSNRLMLIDPLSRDWIISGKRRRPRSFDRFVEAAL